MHTAFTIGILGGCGESLRTAQHFEQMVTYYQKIFPRIRILLPLASKGDRLVASSLLAQKRNNPGLEISVAITTRQWHNYQHGAANERMANCNRIIAAANRCEVVLDNAAHAAQSVLFRFFIEQCDYIIFNERHAGWAETEEFYTQAVNMAVPIPVQYGLKPSKRPDIYYPTDRREYQDPRSRFYAPKAEIEQSIAYIRRNKFSIQADHVPQIFIRKWLATLPSGALHYLIPPEDISGILRLQDTPQHDYLSLKVFAYVYTVRRMKRDMLGETDAIMCFRQFQTLLKLIATKRDAGERIEPFDLLDFDGYGKIMKLQNWEKGAEAAESMETMEAN